MSVSPWDGVDDGDNVIDTHSHLLPGLDDGSPNMEASLRMAAEAEAAGVTTIVCTPHVRDLSRSFVPDAREGIAELRSALAAANIGVRLLLGFEVEISAVALADTDQLRELAIEGSEGAILLETPHWGWPVFIRETVFRLQTSGFTPVLAHPERNDRVQRDPGLLTECLRAGALAQATAASLNDGFGRACRQAFFRHLSRGEISLLASDAHFGRRGSWTLAPLIEMLRSRLSEDDLNDLVAVNPGILLSGGKSMNMTSPAGGLSWHGRFRRRYHK